MPSDLMDAPEDVLRTSLSDLELSLRTYKCLQNCEVSVVGDLLHWDEKRLLAIKGFGLRSLKDLQSALRRLISEPPSRPEGGPDGASNQPYIYETIEGARKPTHICREEVARQIEGENLAVSWSSYLSTLAPREREILLARIHTGATLDHMGKTFGLTRERVRQLQSKSIARFDRESRVGDKLANLFSRLLEGRTQPLYVAALPAEHEWFSDLDLAESLVNFLVAQLLRGRFETITLHGRTVISRCLRVEWAKKQSIARNFIADNAAGHLSEDAARLAVAAIAGTTASELSDELWQYAIMDAHFSERDGQRVLVAFGRGVEQMVTAVLEGSDDPLHYRDIAERVTDLYSPQDIRRVHNAASAVGLLLGRGIYGLRRHIPVTAEEGRYIALLAESVVQEGPEGRQWNSREILEEIESQEPLAVSLSHYEISALLRDSDLHYVGRQLWVAEAHGRGGVHSRIDIRNAVEAILEKEGSPLTNIELHKHVSALRGLGNTFQVHPRGRLIRVGPGTWGLRDRDVDISPHEQRLVLSNLEEYLTKNKRALHVSELGACFEDGYSNEAREWQVLGIAQVESEFKVFTGDYVGLATWSSPNRASVSEAVEVALPLLRDGCSLEEVHSIVEDELKRKISIDIVRYALRNVGARYDRLRGVVVVEDGVDSDEE